MHKRLILFLLFLLLGFGSSFGLNMLDLHTQKAEKMEISKTQVRSKQIKDDNKLEKTVNCEELEKLNVVFRYQDYEILPDGTNQTLFVIWFDELRAKLEELGLHIESISGSIRTKNDIEIASFHGDADFERNNLSEADFPLLLKIQITYIDLITNQTGVLYGNHELLFSYEHSPLHGGNGFFQVPLHCSQKSSVRCYGTEKPYELYSSDLLIGGIRINGVDYLFPDGGIMVTEGGVILANQEITLQHTIQNILESNGFVNIELTVDNTIQNWYNFTFYVGAEDNTSYDINLLQGYEKDGPWVSWVAPFKELSSCPQIQIPTGFCDYSYKHERNYLIHSLTLSGENIHEVIHLPGGAHPEGFIIPLELEKLFEILTSYNISGAYDELNSVISFHGLPGLSLTALISPVNYNGDRSITLGEKENISMQKKCLEQCYIGLTYPALWTVNSPWEDISVIGIQINGVDYLLNQPVQTLSGSEMILMQENILFDQIKNTLSQYNINLTLNSVRIANWFGANPAYGIEINISDNQQIDSFILLLTGANLITPRAEFKFNQCSSLVEIACYNYDNWYGYSGGNYFYMSGGIPQSAPLYSNVPNSMMVGVMLDGNRYTFPQGPIMITNSDGKVIPGLESVIANAVYDTLTSLYNPSYLPYNLLVNLVGNGPESMYYEIKIGFASQVTLGMIVSQQFGLPLSQSFWGVGQFPAGNMRKMCQ